MTLLAVERIKLFSTRSPWWCAALAIVITVGFTALIAANSPEINVNLTQVVNQFGMAVVLVMAALAVTTEYRFGTIRATFLAVPSRTSALLSKTAVVALLAGVIGEIVAFSSWGIANVLKPNADLAINTAGEWRNVAGVGLTFMVGAVLALAVGILVRQTAGAVAIILTWVMLLEGLIGLIPKAGVKIQAWMPFLNADHFLNAGNQGVQVEGVPAGIDFKLSAWGSLGYFAGVAAAMLIVALIVANRRDA
jgi:ABC-2 type transport system permease protein